MKVSSVIFTVWLYLDFLALALGVFKLIMNTTVLFNKNENIYCNWNSSTIPGGTKRDVVFLYATNIGPGLHLAYKSLRSTGSKCRILLFVPEELKLTVREEKLFKIYDIEIIRIREHVRDNKAVPHMDRYEHEYDWLSENIDSVDRVFHTDAFDVFFQGDPFTDVLSNESLLLALEPHQFRSCGWNLAWLKECYGDTVLSQLSHHFILCSGSIGGSAEHYLKLLDLMITSNHWLKCWDASMDQPILNYLIWSGNAKKHGIEYQLTGCNGGFFTMQWCIKGKNILYNEHGQITSLENTVPVYIHQYNRYDQLQKELFAKCGIK